MDEPLAINRKGVAFVKLHGHEALGQLEPLSYALVVARRAGRVLLVFNNYRQYWEVPGGVIDPGEAPEACAAREMLEESGQVAPALHFVGIMEHLEPDGKRQYGALYRADLSEVRPFAPNEEVRSIVL